MHPIAFDELLAPADYLSRREEIREQIFQLKRLRRVDLGQHLTLLFETRETVRYQVQEVVRLDGLTDRAAITAELAYYNRILGQTHSLPGTLLVVDAPSNLCWQQLVPSIELALEDGRRIAASPVGQPQAAAVHELVFQVPPGGRPVSLRSTCSPFLVSVRLSPAQRLALQRDLRRQLTAAA